MNSSDTETRPARPSAWTHPGPGLSIKFLCPRCGNACQQLGSKLRRFQGLRQRVCGPCHGELTK